MFKFLLIFNVFVLCSANYVGHKVNRIVPKHDQHLHFLKSLADEPSLDLDFWSEPRAVGKSVDIRVSPDNHRHLLEILDQHQLAYSTIIDDVSALLEQPLRSPRVGRQRIWDEYLEYDDMMAWIDERGAQCGARCDVTSVGNSYEGNDLKLIKITNGAGTEKDGFWIDAGIHAREWISPAVATYFIDRLIGDYGNDSDVTTMLDTYDFYVLAMMNPDGYIYSHTDDRLWRKSRRPNDDVGSTCFGTDINRNFDHQFGTVGVSDNPCSNTYCGPAAYSEIEAGNVARYIEGATNNWAVFFTLHSYGQLWMAPWGYTTDPPANYDDLIEAGQVGADALEAVHGTRYEVGSASEILYESSGTSRDWAYGVPQIEYVYTLELRDDGDYGFLLPEDQIRDCVEETWAGIKAFSMHVIGSRRL